LPEAKPVRPRLLGAEDRRRTVPEPWRGRGGSTAPAARGRLLGPGRCKDMGYTRVAGPGPEASRPGIRGAGLPRGDPGAPHGSARARYSALALSRGGRGGTKRKAAHVEGPADRRVAWLVDGRALYWPERACDRLGIVDDDRGGRVGLQADIALDRPGGGMPTTESARKTCRCSIPDVVVDEHRVRLQPRQPALGDVFESKGLIVDGSTTR